MSITDELRERIDAVCRVSGLDCKRLTAIADRIDAAHADAVQREHMTAYDAGYDEGYASADDWMADNEDAMAEHGWVRLPKDGEAPCKQLGEWIEKRGLITGPLDHDGELWHKGDMSASPWGEIASIVFDGQCWQVCGHDTSAPWLPADSLLHYHAPTVEDLLDEFASAYDRIGGEDEEHQKYLNLIAEYAKRLRLAGSDAE